MAGGAGGPRSVSADAGGGLGGGGVPADLAQTHRGRGENKSVCQRGVGGGVRTPN